MDIRRRAPRRRAASVPGCSTSAPARATAAQWRSAERASQRVRSEGSCPSASSSWPSCLPKFLPARELVVRPHHGAGSRWSATGRDRTRASPRREPWPRRRVRTPIARARCRSPRPSRSSDSAARRSVAPTPPASFIATSNRTTSSRTEIDEEALLVKVVDFGIAKFQGGPNDHASTRTGERCSARPSTTSPEQARGLKTIDYRTDLTARPRRVHDAHRQPRVRERVVRRPPAADMHFAPLPSLCANALAPRTDGVRASFSACARSGEPIRFGAGVRRRLASRDRRIRPRRSAPRLGGPAGARTPQLAGNPGARRLGRDRVG